MSKIITKIEAQKKKENRVNIYINEEFAFGCSSELVYYHNLAKGREVDINELEEIIEEDNYITAKSLGLKYVEAALKTEYQVKEYLEKKEYSPSVVFRVISFLKEYKFLDDEYYTKAYISQYKKVQGRNNIRYKLLQKGINEEIIDNNLKEFNFEDEIKTALSLTEKKLKILCKKEKDSRKIKQKLNIYLISKGYTYEAIKNVLDSISLEEFIASFEEEMVIAPIGTKVNKKDILIEAEKKYNKLKNTEIDELKLKKKLYDFLLRKGYGFDEVKSILNKLLEETGY